MKITVLIAFVPTDLLESDSENHKYMTYSSESFEIPKDSVYEYLVGKYKLSRIKKIKKQPLEVVFQLISNKIANELNCMGVVNGVYECKITEDNKHYYSDDCHLLQTFVDNRQY